MSPERSVVTNTRSCRSIPHDALQPALAHRAEFRCTLCLVRRQQRLVPLVLLLYALEERARAEGSRGQ